MNTITVVEKVDYLAGELDTYGRCETCDNYSNCSICSYCNEGSEYTPYMELLDRFIINDDKVSEMCKEAGLDVTDEMIHEIMFRCDSLEIAIDDEGDTIDKNINACIEYIKENGFDSLFDEEDDSNIWEYC